MRLIDADALIDDLKHDVAVDQDSLDYEELTDLNRENIQFDKDCKQNAIDLLKHAPTIEPERKKGKWINHRCDDGHHIADCDQCGHSLQWFDDNIPKYCCECGADMEYPEDIPMEYFESGGR